MVVSGRRPAASGRRSNQSPVGSSGAATTLAVLPLTGAPMTTLTLVSCERRMFWVKPARSPVRFQASR